MGKPRASLGLLAYRYIFIVSGLKIKSLINYSCLRIRVYTYSGRMRFGGLLFLSYRKGVRVDIFPLVFIICRYATSNSFRSIESKYSYIFVEGVEKVNTRRTPIRVSSEISTTR